MTLHGYSDWHRVDQHAGAPLFNVTAVPDVANVIQFGSAFCGDASYLYVNATNQVRGMTLIAIFYVDAALTIQLTSAQWTVDSASVSIIDHIAVGANFVKLSAVLPGAAGTNLVNLLVVPVTMTKPPTGGGSTLELINDFNRAIGAGGNATVFALWSCGGPATFQLQTDAAIFTVLIDGMDSVAASAVRVVFGTNTSDPGGAVYRRFNLPRRRLKLFMVNGDGVIRNFTSSLTLEP